MKSRKNILIFYPYNKIAVDQISVIELLSKKHNIFFRHVKAHQPMPNNKYSDKYKIWYGNHMADKFATDASQLSMN